jgi:hypothetical protein
MADHINLFSYSATRCPAQTVVPSRAITVGRLSRVMIILIRPLRTPLLVVGKPASASYGIQLNRDTQTRSVSLCRRMIYLLFSTQVKAAAEKALAEFKKKNPNADPSDIKVDIPKAPPAPAGPAGPGGIHYHVVYNQNVNNNNFNIAAMNAHQARLQQMPQPQAGMWGAGMYMPPPPPVVHPGVPIAAAPPVPAFLPPAPAPAPGRRAPARGAALIAQARRAGANRRKANPDGPRIAHHAAHLRAEPAPIQRRRPGPEIPPAPAPAQNVFHFGPAALGGLGIMPQQQQQHLQEAFNVNERLARQRLAEAFNVNERLARQRLADGQGARQNEWRRGVAAPANPAPADDERNQLERRLLDAQQRVMRDRMALQRQMEPLGMYQAQGLPAMGYHAGLGMPMVPQNFGGPQYQARK